MVGNLSEPAGLVSAQNLTLTLSFHVIYDMFQNKSDRSISSDFFPIQIGSDFFFNIQIQIEN